MGYCDHIYFQLPITSIVRTELSDLMKFPLQNAIWRSFTVTTYSCQKYVLVFKDEDILQSYQEFSGLTLPPFKYRPDRQRPSATTIPPRSMRRGRKSSRPAPQKFHADERRGLLRKLSRAVSRVSKIDQTRVANTPRRHIFSLQRPGPTIDEGGRNTDQTSDCKRWSCESCDTPLQPADLHEDETATKMVLDSSYAHIQDLAIWSINSRLYLATIDRHCERRNLLLYFSRIYPELEGNNTMSYSEALLEKYIDRSRSESVGRGESFSPPLKSPRPASITALMMANHRRSTDTASNHGSRLSSPQNWIRTPSRSPMTMSAITPTISLMESRLPALSPSHKNIRTRSVPSVEDESPLVYAVESKNQNPSPREQQSTEMITAEESRDVTTRKMSASSRKGLTICTSNVFDDVSVPPTPKTSSHSHMRIDIYADYYRMGVMARTSGWRMTDINASYGLCDTYPPLLWVPLNVADPVISEGASFRSKGRIPVLSWWSNVTKCSLTRSSQPMVGMGTKRSEADEYLLAEIAVLRSSDVAASTGKGLLVCDARPHINAFANLMAGMGTEPESNYTECQVVYLNIANIHVMRESMQALQSEMSRCLLNENPVESRRHVLGDKSHSW
eukprot:CAMPEP_0182426618 /NCGR_PEP_ID=MMETSP1167-20130531/13131_1 /TAXON_ID=2988 /ORGANISM="Mallomonas Sp, Strain CCMP3275" /LENGTH=617 /DNA_ID=CAMNT_0024608195 /DNA_START=275 /DNA_END=2125 /DNA_ORIENTATION=+